MIGKCELCEQEEELYFHHLVPRTVHTNKWFKKNYTREQMNTGIDVCKLCHKHIHITIDNKLLGKNFNTKELLIADERILKFINWRKRKDEK